MFTMGDTPIRVDGAKTRYFSDKTSLQAASDDVLAAHHALGRMYGSTTAEEFSAAAAEFLDATRAVTQTLARDSRADDVSAVMRRAFELDASTLITAATVRMTRLARGSGPHSLPAHDSSSQREVRPAPAKARPEDFYFAGFDRHPAIHVCAEFLERVTSALDKAKRVVQSD